MHVSRKADYAVRALSFMSTEPERRMLISEIAESMAIPRAFLSKIMKELVEAGLVASQVGPGGGYRLTRDPKDINFRQILEVVEGPWNLVPCQAVDSADACVLLENCSQVSIWDQIRAEMLDVFQNYTLDRVTQPPVVSGRANRSSPPDGTTPLALIQVG